MASAHHRGQPAEEDCPSPSRRSSGRKQLPSVPPQDAAAASAPRRLLQAPRLPGADGADGGLPPGHGYFSAFVKEYLLLSEYNLLQQQRLPGIYVVPSARSPLHWFGVVFVRQGPYQEGVFRFNLLMPEDFPDGACPRVVFTPPFFHPMVDPSSGEMDVQKGFPQWRRGVHYIWQLLLFVRRAFYKFNALPAFDAQAAQLFMSDKEAFRERAQQASRQSREKLFDPPATDDPHYLRFSPFDAGIHGPSLVALTQPKKKPSAGKTAQGLSWVQTGTLQPFAGGPVPSSPPDAAAS